ncbi:hypothetical protein ebA340 [Aromatoleum aromaticum EbN1]|uniref:Uncharacterized protein n=1 Tax=Aromatoleum aromaticum (strain DSM 19018 / LMG 30748 / EbN1) TaxID=76114 RepID=Q5P8R0_AROAE|nr:hypothetical protein ebA340 [Aromatoleum aromaticum EbN1]
MAGPTPLALMRNHEAEKKRLPDTCLTAFHYLRAPRKTSFPKIAVSINQRLTETISTKLRVFRGPPTSFIAL